MAAALALVGTAALMEQLLASALEANNQFRVIWRGRTVGVGIIALGTVLMVVHLGWHFLAAGLLLGWMASHAIQVGICSRRSILDARRHVLHFTAATGIGVIIGLPAWAQGATSSIDWSSIAGVGLTGALWLAYVGTLWRNRRRIPAMRSTFS